MSLAEAIGVVIFLYWAMHLVTVSFCAVESNRIAFAQRLLALAMVIAAVALMAV